MMENWPRLFITVIAIMTQTVLGAQVFLEYRHESGDQWHLTSLVEQEIFYDGYLQDRTEILNKISVEVLEGQGAEGHIYNRYQIAERQSDSELYTWSAEFETSYFRNTMGYSSGLKPDPPIPSVRDIPIYPSQYVEVGDTWTAFGSELFDLEPSYGIDEIAVIDFEALYTYVGPKSIDGKDTHEVRIEYSYDWLPEKELAARLRRYPVYPVNIIGEFYQQVYWDPVAGRNYAEEGQYSYSYIMNDEHFYTFQGSTHGKAIYVESMNRDTLLDQIEEMNDVQALATEEGVKIILDNIHFVSNSAQMLPGEEKKLAYIAEIFQKHPTRDILIMGHTARVNAHNDGLQLSEQRALAVADYFISKGVRTATQIITRGMGHAQPLADNAIEEGRKKNRRVEIIILEN